MGFKEILANIRNKNEVYEQLKTEDSAREKLESRKLSANERALNKIVKEKREKYIAKELKKHYAKEDKEYWHKDVITQPNIFKGGTSIMHQRNLFKR